MRQKDYFSELQPKKKTKNNREEEIRKIEKRGKTVEEKHTMFDKGSELHQFLSVKEYKMTQEFQQKPGNLQVLHYLQKTNEKAKIKNNFKEKTWNARMVLDNKKIIFLLFEQNEDVRVFAVNDKTSASSSD